jgi:hypothetical protein
MLDDKYDQGYDIHKNYKHASRSIGFPIVLELRLFITLQLLSGASFLDMIWYGVSLKSIPELFWKTVCEIYETVDNINFSTDSLGVMKKSC